MFVLHHPVEKWAALPLRNWQNSLRRLTLYSTVYVHISKRRAERFHLNFVLPAHPCWKIPPQVFLFSFEDEYLSASSSTDFLPLCRANHRPGHDKVLAATGRAGESPLEIPHQHLTSLPHLASGRFLLSGRKCWFPSHATPRFQLLWQRRSRCCDRFIISKLFIVWGFSTCVRGWKPLTSPPTQVKSQFKLPFPSLSRVGLGRLNIATGLLLCQGHFLHPPGGVILSYAPTPPLPETIFFGHLGVTFTAVLCQEQYILSFYMYKVPEASYLSYKVAGAVFDDESTKCSHWKLDYKWAVSLQMNVLGAWRLTVNADAFASVCS